MGETPDQLKQDIEQTRAELTHHTDRLVNRADPRNVVNRRTRRMREKAQSMKDRVMGAAPSASQSKEGMRRNADQAAEAVKSAPQQVAQQAQGNPVAAGLIAFGAGLLTASLISESRAERRAAQSVQEHAGEMVEPARQAVMDSADRVKEQATESAREAQEHLKDSASEAARSTGEQAQQEARSAAEQARGS